MGGGTHTRLDGLFSRIRLVLSVVSALLTYRGAVLPQVRGELRRWERWTVKIPDLALRDAALSAIREKSSNVEATAVFAILAPRSQRSSALRAMTALQTTIEYLDVIGEQLPDEPLADGLALHGALVEAVTPGAPYSDWYHLHPQTEDGGYLAELVATCQREVATRHRVTPLSLRRSNPRAAGPKGRAIPMLRSEARTTHRSWRHGQRA
jgi:tetraprenyl-beta-curcumene synthase